VVIYLDNRHRIIEYEELFTGTLNGASVHPREVVKNVLFHNAAAVIIAHNHPSGIAEPSQSDMLITKKIQDALKLIDVTLLDHLIIGDGTYVSLSDRGMI
jgi:DNA repair protein RadC